MKNLLLLPLVLILASCTTMSGMPTTCYQKAAIAEVSISEAYERLIAAVHSGMMVMEDGKKAYDLINLSNNLLDQATAMCGLDNVMAADYVLQAMRALNKALLYMGEV